MLSCFLGSALTSCSSSSFCGTIRSLARSLLHLEHASESTAFGSTTPATGFGQPQQQQSTGLFGGGASSFLSSVGLATSHITFTDINPPSSFIATYHCNRRLWKYCKRNTCIRCWSYQHRNNRWWPVWFSKCFVNSCFWSWHWLKRLFIWCVFSCMHAFRHLFRTSVSQSPDLWITIPSLRRILTLLLFLSAPYCSSRCLMLQNACASNRHPATIYRRRSLWIINRNRSIWQQWGSVWSQARRHRRWSGRWKRTRSQ